MAAMKTNNSNTMNHRNGETVVRRANILASCYVVDSSAILKGFHYSTTGADGLPSPPSSPPLAALNSANELALTPKLSARKRDKDGKMKSRREGAAYIIREECERLFCEIMKTVFLGERGADYNGSIEMETLHYPGYRNANRVNSWLEVWDYAGGCSFRGFVANSGTEKSLFVFFSTEVVGNDLKTGLMALIELAATPFECTQVVVCLERMSEAEESRALMKSLRWVGFELITMEMWANQKNVTSDKWLFLGMEL